jgi:DNA polymerase-4
VQFTAAAFIETLASQGVQISMDGKGRFSVTLADLSPANARQLDLLLNDDGERQKCEVLTNTIDRLNQKFGKRVVTIGSWTPPPGGYAGGKIAYNRIPSAEDFW